MEIKVHQIPADKRIRIIGMNNPEELKRAHQAVREIFEATLACGGTISGEHGIGITKAPYLAMEIGTKNQEFMQRIKDLLDPNHILNPGKLSLT